MRQALIQIQTSQISYYTFYNVFYYVALQCMMVEGPKHTPVFGKMTYILDIGTSLAVRNPSWIRDNLTDNNVGLHLTSKWDST